MFLTNGLKAKLIKYNRDSEDVIYDDELQEEEIIKICPYDVSNGVAFGIYTVPNASGYFQVGRKIDVREGDQITFEGKTYTVLNVQDNWLFNRVENKILAVR